MVNGALAITGDHPVLALQDGRPRWTRTDRLAAGMVLKTASGSVPIEEVRLIEDDAATVYLATGAGNFLVCAGGHRVIVHGDYQRLDWAKRRFETATCGEVAHRAETRLA